MITGKPGGMGYFNTIFSPSLVKEYENNLKEKFLCDTIYAVAERSNEFSGEKHMSEINQF